MLDSRQSLIFIMYVADSRTLTANIRQRRGSLVDIRVPLYMDKNTAIPEGQTATKSLSNGVAGAYLQTYNAVRSLMGRPSKARGRYALHPHGCNGFWNG